MQLGTKKKKGFIYTSLFVCSFFSSFEKKWFVKKWVEFICRKC